MTVTRTSVRDLFLGFDGYLDGAGYDVANQFSSDLGRGAEAWCADSFSDVYKRAGLALPPMQEGLRTGFAYVPDAVAYARVHSAAVPSWQAQPGDAVCFDWNHDGTADHVEMCDHLDGNTLYTVGGNSGPSNVNAYRGQGGVHRHQWAVPSGVGNPQILAVIDMSKIVTFGVPGKQTQPGKAPAYPMLMLKSPLIKNEHVRQVQLVLHREGFWGATPTGVYDTTTRGAVYNYQRAHSLPADGIVGPATYKSMGVNF